MPYIKVSPSALNNMSETLRNSSSKVGRIDDDFSSVARKLDWDVRSASDIQRRMDRIIDALEDHARMLGDMRSFIDEAKRKYEAAQKEDGKLQKHYLSKVDKAIIALDESMMTEAEKLAEREKTADIARWTTAIGCTVIMIAAGIVLGPVSPALILFGIGTGAITAAVNNISDQYVEDGTVDDWNSIGTDAVIGGVVGGVSSAIGVGVGNATQIGGKAATSLISKNSASHAFFQNSFVRIGSQAVVGGFAETAEGFGKDFYGTLIETGGDLEAAVDEATDFKRRGLDLAMGAVIGGGSEALKIAKQSHIDKLHSADVQDAKKKAQEAVDNAASNYNKNSVGVVEAEHRAGLKNIRQARNGAADFGESDYILRNDAGEAASFRIKAVDNEAAEKDAIKIQLEKGGFNIDLDDQTYTIHRMADFDVNTEEFTVQIVETQAKKAFDRARGPYASAQMQYRIMHGGGYGKEVNRAAAAYVEPKVPERKDSIDLPSFVEDFADGVNTFIDMSNAVT